MLFIALSVLLLKLRNKENMLNGGIFSWSLLIINEQEQYENAEWLFRILNNHIYICYSNILAAYSNCIKSKF